MTNNAQKLLEMFLNAPLRTRVRLTRMSHLNRSQHWMPAQSYKEAWEKSLAVALCKYETPR
jgi:hypothetical protein